MSVVRHARRREEFMALMLFLTGRELSVLCQNSAANFENRQWRMCLFLFLAIRREAHNLMASVEEQARANDGGRQILVFRSAAPLLYYFLEGRQRHAIIGFFPTGQRCADQLIMCRIFYFSVSGISLWRLRESSSSTSSHTSFQLLHTNQLGGI